VSAVGDHGAGHPGLVVIPKAEGARHNARSGAGCHPSPVSVGLPSGSVTFLLTDIEGSTPLLKRLGERYEPLL
jgi:hypothetical protein